MSHSPTSSSTTTAGATTAAPSWLRDLLCLTLILSLWFGLFLGARPLSNPDEGRYTEIPREMAATGDFVTPRLDGVKYFEKPPLLYWLSALTIKTTGANEWSARLWFALFAVIGGLATYASARALHGRATGWWAAIVLSTSLLYYTHSRTAILDLPVAVLIAGALFAFLLGVREPARAPAARARRRWLFWTFYAAMALAVLAKGLIGFLLPCAVAFVWLLVFNQWRHLRPCHPVTGALILLAIAAPWHILAALANQSPVKEYDFAWFYFVHEHYLRFTTATHSRVAPWYFFILVIIAGLIPWTAFAWQALRENLRAAWNGVRPFFLRSRPLPSGGQPQKERPDPLFADGAAVWFLLTWIIVITLFFSISKSKLIPYILPVFPAFAVLIGRYIASALSSTGFQPVDGEAAGLSGTGCQPVGRRDSAANSPDMEAQASRLPDATQSRPIENRESKIENPQNPCGFRIGLRAAALIAIAFAAALIIYPIVQPAKIAVLDITPGWLTAWQIFLGIVLGGGGILVAALTSMRRERAALGVLVGIFATFMLSANFIAGPFDVRSTKTVSLALRDHLAANPNAEVYTVGEYFQDIPVYANRLVNVVNYLGELKFGVEAEPEKSARRFISTQEFSRRWQNTSQRAYAIVQKRDLERYFAALPHAILAQNARYLLLVNTPDPK